MGQRNDCPAVSWIMFILNNLERQWLSDFDSGHFKLFITELLENKIPFFPQFLTKVSFKT